MSEGNYKVVCTSLEIKDPEPFAETYNNDSGNKPSTNKYRFEMATKTQTKKDMGLTRTVYHGQSIIKTATQYHIIPFFELKSTAANTPYTIGRIILEISDVTGVNNDNDAQKQLFQLVGTTQENTLIVASNVNSSDTALTALTPSNFAYTSNFYLDGLAASKTKKWIIDLNKVFISHTSSTTSYISLALKFNTVLVEATTIKIDAYTEIIS